MYFARRIPGTEEPGGPQSIGLQSQTPLNLQACMKITKNVGLEPNNNCTYSVGECIVVFHLEAGTFEFGCCCCC